MFVCVLLCWLHRCAYMLTCIPARLLQTPCLCLARLHSLCPSLHVADAYALSASACCPSSTLYTLALCLFSCAMVPVPCSLCDVYSACPPFLSALSTSVCSLFRYAACICVFLCVVHSCVPVHFLCFGPCDLFTICFLWCASCVQTLSTRCAYPAFYLF